MLSRAPGTPAPFERPRGPVRLHPALPAGSSIAQNDFALTADGFALLRADAETPQQSELFAVPARGSEPLRKLNATLTPGPAEGDVLEFAWSGEQVVYSASQRAEGFFELFTVVPEQAPDYEQIVELATYGCTVQEFRLAPDGTRAVYVASDATPGLYELYSVLLDGSAAPVKLNGPIASPGGDVHEDFLLTPDGLKVVFKGGLEDEDVFELFVAPVDGAVPAQRLHPPLSGLLDVQPGMQVSSDGARVVYLADALVDERIDLFSAPLDASQPPVRLDATLIANGDVTAFLIAPDGTFVLYTADQAVDERYELFRVPIDGSQPPLRLSMPLGAGGSVFQDFEVTPDSARVVFKAKAATLARSELYSVPADGSQAPLRLHPEHLFVGGIGSSVLQPSGERVVYIEYEDVTGLVGLFSVPVDGSEAPLEIAPREANPVDIEELRLSPTGDEVLYVVRGGIYQDDELYQAAVGGSHEPREIGVVHGAPQYLFSPDSTRVLVRTSTVPNGSVELFTAPADGSSSLVPVNDPLVPGGNVTAFSPLPVGDAVLYRADQDEDEVFELYIAPLP